MHGPLAWEFFWFLGLRNDVHMLYEQAVPEQTDTQLDDDTPSVHAEACSQSAT